MSTKTYFKRISLAVILALSFGAFSSAPSQALLSNSAAITVSAATDSKIALETSTVTITASFTATATGETFVVRVIGTGANSTDVPYTRITTADSLNITSGVSAAAVTASTGAVLTATTADLLTRVKLTLDIPKVTNVGTHTYNVNLYSSTSGAAVVLVAQTTYTVTVAAANNTATAGQSQLFLNEVLPTTTTYTMSDSLNLIKSAGQTSDLTLMTPSKVAYLGVNFKNSAGESVVSTTGNSVTGTMTVKITQGPGLISKVMKLRSVNSRFLLVTQLPSGMMEHLV